MSFSLGHSYRRRDGATVRRALDNKTYKGWFNWIRYAREHKLKAYGQLYDPSWGSTMFGEKK